MFLLSKNYTIKILYLIILKFFRMINKNEFKERVFSITINGKDYSSRMKNFSKMLNSSINPVILSNVKKHTDKNQQTHQLNLEIRCPVCFATTRPTPRRTSLLT